MMLGFYSSNSQCDALAKDAVKLWTRDLVEIGRASLKDLLNIFDKLYNDYQDFERGCFDNIAMEIYEHFLTCFNIALLKLVVAIEDKVLGTGVVEEHVKSIINMFSDVEKKMLREFEKFKSLDPKVTPPELLADYIVSKSEGIYELVKEAIDKQYIKFEELIESWSRTEKMGNYVRKGFEVLYRSRFRNIVEAIKILIEKQPAWIRRLFSDYEEALLSSNEVRERFEQKVREVFEDKLNNIRTYVEKLEEEKKELLSRVEELSRRSIATEEEKRLLESQLNRLQQELQDLRSKYEEVLKKWERNLEELNDLRKQLIKKEEELEKLSNKEKENIAAREALEAEILRLKQLVNSYEMKINEYEKEKEKLLLELRAMEEKISIIDRMFKGGSSGRDVRSDEALLLEMIFIGNLRCKLMSFPIAIETPWGEEVIRGWDEVREYGENLEIKKIPKNTRVVFKYEKRGFLGLRYSKSIEIWAVFVSNIDNLKKFGVDSRATDIMDLVKILNEIGDRDGDKEKTFTIIGIASPTGWSKEAVKYAQGDGVPPLSIDNRVVFLVDPLENKVYYPIELAKSRPYIEKLVRLFKIDTFKGIDVKNGFKNLYKIIDFCDKVVIDCEEFLNRIRNNLNLYNDIIEFLSTTIDNVIQKKSLLEDENRNLCLLYNTDLYLHYVKSITNLVSKESIEVIKEKTRDAFNTMKRLIIDKIANQNARNRLLECLNKIEKIILEENRIPANNVCENGIIIHVCSLIGKDYSLKHPTIEVKEDEESILISLYNFTIGLIRKSSNGNL